MLAAVLLLNAEKSLGTADSNCILNPFQGHSLLTGKHPPIEKLNEAILVQQDFILLIYLGDQGLQNETVTEDISKKEGDLLNKHLDT